MKDSYRIDLHVADSLKVRSIILHALPRTTEISPEVDQDARAAYFRQATERAVCADGSAEVFDGLAALIFGIRRI